MRIRTDNRQPDLFMEPILGIKQNIVIEQSLDKYVYG